MLGLFVILCLICGATLVTRGLRGRRVGDHPHCRRCGFDLFGAPAGATQCPECGGAAGDAVRGRFERRRRPLAIGAAMLGVAAVCVALIASGASRSWRHWEPTWLALREADGSVPGDRSAAIDLLVARDAAGALDDAQRQRLDAIAVGVVARRELRWRPAWGERLLARMAGGALADTDRDAYAAELVRQLGLTIRPIVRAGDAPPLRWRYLSSSLGASPGRPVQLCVAATPTIRVDGREIDVTRIANAEPAFQAAVLAGAAEQSAGGQAEALRGIAPGTHEIRWQSRVTLHDGAGDGPVIAETTYETRATLTVLPPGQSDVKLVSGDAGLPAMQRAMRPESIHLPANRNEPPHLHLAAKENVPFGVACDLFIARDGVERRVGQLTIREGERRSTYVDFACVQSDLPPGPATVIFRRSEALARSTIDVTSIWDGELRFNVEVQDLAK